MALEADIERLIASIAERTPISWDALELDAGDARNRARLAALRGIAGIAAFGRAQWQRHSAQLERSRDEAHVVAAASAPGEPRVGQAVGAYTLESLIGQGGMGQVWCARRADGRFEGQAAVKLLHAPLIGRHGRGRFQREGQILARLRHPNIAQLLDAGITDSGQPFLVLEHVDGVAIDAYCDAHRLELPARIRLFLAVLEAVAHAQANLVLHRDLKPSNILVDRSGRVKLLDFGVAKLIADEAADAVETEVTRGAGRAFTPEFAAPEQFLGSPATTATDVYAAGVVLYLLLTGSHPTPLVRGSPLDRMRAVLESEPRLASATAVATDPRRGRALRGDLDNILAKSLKKAAAERYATAAAFANDLTRYLRGEPVAAHADTLRYRAGKFVRRHRQAVFSAVAASLALATVAGVAIVERGEARRQRDAAQEQTRRADAFSSVITSLLSQVGPGGRPLGPEELLDRAVDEMEARYHADPAFLADMLVRISGRYYDLQITRKELATLVKAEQAARRAGDPALVFDVQVNTVETELAAGNRRGAQQRIAEARALLPTLRSSPDLADYWRAEAKVARASGDMAAAIRYFEQARARLEGEQRTHGNVYPGILSELALSQHLAGDSRGAYETTLRIVELDRQHGRETSLPGITTRATLAAGMYYLGQVQRARGMFEAVVPEIARPGAEILPNIAERYGEVLSRLGRHDEALRLIGGAIPPLVRGGNQAIEVRMRLSLARALVRAGRLEAAHCALDTAAAVMGADPEAYRIWLAEASRLRAEAYLAGGRATEARREAESALQRHGYPQNRREFGLPAAVLTEARAELALAQAERAAAAAGAAAALFEATALDAASSADVGEALLLLAQAQLAAGRGAEARGTAARAARCLSGGLGADHERTREAAGLAAQL